jgi:hypothetical protein
MIQEEIRKALGAIAPKSEVTPEVTPEATTEPEVEPTGLELSKGKLIARLKKTADSKGLSCYDKVLREALEMGPEHFAAWTKERDPDGLPWQQVKRGLNYCYKPVSGK